MVFDEELLAQRLGGLLAKPVIDRVALGSLLASSLDICLNAELEQSVRADDQVLKGMKMIQKFTKYVYELCNEQQKKLSHLRTLNFEKQIRLKELFLTYNTLKRVHSNVS